MNIPLTVSNQVGRHNTDLNFSIKRLTTARSALELSVICIVPTSGLVPAKVVERWMMQMSQMNQKFIRFPVITSNKNHAYNTNIEQIIATPKMNEFKYILTMEEDFLPPVDGLIKLFEDIEEYDAVSGLMFTKGEESKAMIYGHPNQIPSTYTPVPPMVDNGLQPCLGLPTGFTIFKLDIFKDTRIPKPWFRTVSPFDVGKPKNQHDDQYFFENIHKLGYKVAVDTRIKVAHCDPNSEVIW